LPECRDPVELNDYAIATDEIFLGALTTYAVELHDKTGKDIVARYPRRTVDSAGNVWACHDNFSVPEWFARVLEKNANSVHSRSEAAELLLRHLVDRPFLSGAGHMNPDGSWRFAQKADSVLSVFNYGFVSSHFRTDYEHGTRLEVRDSDRNVLSAAEALRVGSTALVLAIAQTPEAHQLIDKTQATYAGDGRLGNKLVVNPDGTLQSSERLRVSADNERRYAEFCLNQLGNYVNVKPRYRKLAADWYAYCEDFGDVLRGKKPIDVLADRSDWARRRRQSLDYEAELAGLKLSDRQRSAKLRARAMTYDTTTVLVRGGKTSRSDGPGVRAQLDEKLPYATTQEAVARAKVRPPRTRASHRTHVLQKYDVLSHSWQRATVKDGGKAVKIRFLPAYRN
jgi:hypothetical protein